MINMANIKEHQKDIATRLSKGIRGDEYKAHLQLNTILKKIYDENIEKVSIEQLDILTKQIDSQLQIIPTPPQISDIITQSETIIYNMEQLRNSLVDHLAILQENLQTLQNAVDQFTQNPSALPVPDLHTTIRGLVDMHALFVSIVQDLQKESSTPKPKPFMVDNPNTFFKINPAGREKLMQTLESQGKDLSEMRKMHEKLKAKGK